MAFAFIPFLHKHIRTVARVSNILSVVLIGDFLLLVTSLVFHWWRPVWGATTLAVMLVGLLALCGVYSLLSVFRIRLNVQRYRRRGYDLLVVRQLIASTEGLLLLTLCGAWGWLVLEGQPSTVPLKLLGFVWVSGFIGFVVLQFYEIGRKRRHKSLQKA